MKLNEKIITCRKQKGYSQEKLAEILGVSRQSVSKWETGESTPDVYKLASIAKAFDVTMDWLMNDVELKEEKTINKSYPDWLDKLPSNVLTMVQKFGWIFGLYIMGGGVVLTAFGCLARFMFKTMILGDMTGMMNEYFTGDFPAHIMEGILMDPQYNFYSEFDLQGWKIASTFTGFIIGLGLITIVIGLLLAFVLKTWGDKELRK